MYGLKWLVDHHAIAKSALNKSYASYVGGIFRTVRYGVGEAHGKAEIMEFNYLASRRPSAGTLKTVVIILITSACRGACKTRPDTSED